MGSGKANIASDLRAGARRHAARAPWLLLAAAMLLWPGEVASSEQHAYIGPGAGIALLGSFFAVFSALLSSLLYITTWPIRMLWRALRGGRAYRRAKTKRVVVVGLDGLEPSLTEQFMDEGLLPNLTRLRETGSYTRLGTTTPPLSPVAWSSFSTGTNPGKHNIFDFIACNRTYQPTQSSVRIGESRRTLRLGKAVIPLSKPQITGLRRSKPFWTVLGEAGVFSAVLRVPITFPPDKFRGVQLSAMCVPDLRGTHGMFSYFTENGATNNGHDEESEASVAGEGEVGGDVIQVTRRNGAVEGFLRGPVNTLHADRPDLRARFKVAANGDGSATLRVSGQRIRLVPNEHSEWVPVHFKVLGGLVKVHGVCRFFLKRFDAPFEMYCTPIQLDPEKPVMPISHPRNYAAYLARLDGTYATLGLAEDTWSLSEDRLNEDAFLEQAYNIHDERMRMFFDALRRLRRGLIVCVFDGPDRIQHMFWRFIDEKHPALDSADRNTHRHVIRDMYIRMDDLVGRTVESLDSDTVLFVMSDHGFKSFRRGVDLNAWLEENGYLALKEGADRPSGAYLRDIDWSRTRAFALGLAGIFLNRVGHKAQGIVPAEEAGPLAREISDSLTGLRDPEFGEVAIHEAMPRETVYTGPYVETAPEIIVGYNVGYRVSWDAVIGKCGTAIFSDNRKAWSGDHCIHPSLVPGVLFCSDKLNGANGGANIVDLAPTVLDLFGVPKPSYVEGTSLLCAESP